ncbi:MAG: hypothetical protein MR019_07850 [Ruminococcus sp.]|nr:hypothetical protein [Ruminococcus sp.]MDY3895062.1 hypothetical protein [Candidatus Fimenecus sp.]
MADRNMSSGFSLDDILSETEKDTEKAPGKLWSLAEIDALLADEGLSEPEETHGEQIGESEKKVEHAEKKYDFAEEKTDEAPVLHISKKEPDKKSNDSFSIDPAIFDEILSGGRHKEKNEDKKSKNTEAETKTAEKSFAEEKSADKISHDSEFASEVLPENPLFEGTTPSLTGDNENSPVQSEDKSVPGQISLEKTRVFNEVDARAIHSEKIEHHIGKKITRTTSSEFTDKKAPAVKKGMETDKYRERFLNKPKLDMEKTREHEKLMSSLPPKTIEKFGVIVKKPDGEKTSEEGLMPVPTIISAEDELKVQKSNAEKYRTGELKSLAKKNSADEDTQQLQNQIKLDGFEEEDKPETVDEYEAEIELLGRRNKKAKSFKLQPAFRQTEKEEVRRSEPEESDSDEENKTAEKIRKNIRILDDLPEEDENGDIIDESAYDEDDGEDFEPKKKRSRRNREKSKADDEPIRIAREYYSNKDAKAVYDIMMGNKRKATAKIIIFVIFLVVLTLFSTVKTVLSDLSAFGNSEYAFLGVNLVLLLIAALIDFGEIKKSFSLLGRKKITRSLCVTVALFAGVLQCIAAFSGHGALPDNIHIYAPAVFIPLIFTAAADKARAKNDIANFEYIVKHPEELYSVSKIEDEGEAFEIGRGLLLGDPDIRYSAKIGFPSKFVEMTLRRDPSDDVYALSLPAVLAAAVLTAVVAGVISKNLIYAVSAFTAVTLIGLPVSSCLSAFDILKGTNKFLRRSGSLVSGYYAAEDASTANAVVIDASDLFLYGGCSLHGFKLYNSMRIDDAFLYTAAVVIKSGGALADVFDSVILSKRDILPPVESLVYEEKLGCSCWINNQRVLVGNRDLLSKHNVTPPSEEEESKFLSSGRQVLYLAVEGKTAAGFSVEYKPNGDTAKYLNKLEKYGVSVLVRTTDPNITEELIEQYFDLPHGFVKVISPVAGKMFKDLYETVKPSGDCKVIHDGSVYTLLKSFAAAFLITDKFRLSSILQYIGVGIGILAVAAMAFTSGLSQAGALQIMLFVLIWTALVIFIPRFKKP